VPPNAIRVDLGFRRINATVANFSRASAEAAPRLAATARRGAEAVEERARAICPVRTGRMQRLIRSVFTESGLIFETGWFAEDFFAEREPFYPIYVEWGTRFMAAQPTIGPAFASVTPLYQQWVRDDVRYLTRILGR
jgi:HK97 gp10 family phage protein